MELPVFNVSQLIDSVNQTFDYAYQTIEVVGEVASYKESHGKYVFFDVKDETASVGCFMMKYQLRTHIEDGMRVRIKATLTVTQKGKFSLTVASIRIIGEGDIKHSFEMLKQKLTKEGLFALDKKRPLPDTITKIAVITSIESAGYVDFVKVLDERWGGIAIDVVHVKVQGDDAAPQIVSALTYLNQQDVHYDCIVLVRGGGSAEDLAVFNDEPLVRAIAQSRTLTVVGVGHEVDVSLADLACDVRASTPTHAAAIIVPHRDDMRVRIHQVQKDLIAKIEQVIATKKQAMDDTLYQLLERYEEYIEDAVERRDRSLQVLKAYDPHTVLERGYSIVRGEIVKGAQIQIQQSDKIIEAEVKNVTT